MSHGGGVIYLVILSGVHSLRVEVDGRDGHEQRLCARQRNLRFTPRISSVLLRQIRSKIVKYLAATILGPIKLARSRPALVNAFLHQVAEVFVERVAGSIVVVEAAFEVFARCSSHYSVWVSDWNCSTYLTIQLTCSALLS
jgi:hypothetical protein